jgi:hypothetical protein
MRAFPGLAIAGRIAAFSAIGAVVVVVCAGPAIARADGYLAGSLTIDSGAGVTSSAEVTVALSGPADSAGDVRLSNDGSTWLQFPWAATISWSLTDPDAGGVDGDGPRMVSVEYGDGTTWSDASTASILLDTTPPSIDSLTVNVIDPAHDGYGAQYRGTASDAGSGVTGQRYSLNGVDWSDWMASTGGLLSGVDLHKGLYGGTFTGGDRVVYVEVRDAAGNVSAPGESHVLLPSTPVDLQQTAKTTITMSMPLAPVTGQTFTLHPNYPAGFVMPSDAFCQWILTWGSHKSIIYGPPDKDYGEVWFQRPAAAGGCTEWTFTLPYTTPRLYYWQFSLLSKPTGAPEYAAHVTIAEISDQLETEFHAALGTTERRILHSNIGITYLLPDTTTPAPGASMTYRLYATDASRPPQTGLFWAYAVDCYINPQLSQQGGDSFTYRPSCTGPWDTGWTGTYHGPWYMRNQFDPVEDRRAPAMHGPTLTAAATRLSGTAVPVTISWWAADSQSGVWAYQLQVSRNGGAYGSITLPSRLSTSAVRNLSPTGTYRFRVRARDRSGNWSAWRYSSTVRATLVEQTYSHITWTGAWSANADSAWTASSARTTSTPGSAAMRCTCRAVSWVTSTGADRGVAQVFIDGTLAATVNLNSPTLVSRRIAFAKSWPVTGVHTIQIRALGTAVTPRVDLDAFAIIR